MLRKQVRECIQQAVDKLLQEKCPGRNPRDFRIAIEQPALMKHGDYSASIAMQLASAMRMPPSAIAGLLVELLKQDERINRLFHRIDVVSPGYINFHVYWPEWVRTPFLPVKPEHAKAIVEHTSINPNKSAHIGHLRNACIGDTVARMLKRCGYQVEVHNYIDDLGNQLADTVVGLLHLLLAKEHGRFGDFCWDIYSAVHQLYEKKPQLQEERARVLHALEEGHNSQSWLGLLVAERIAREHLEEMNRFGIGYDLLVWESNIVREGFWSAARMLLEQTACFTKEQTGKLAGCWVLRQADSREEEGVDKEHHADKVLVRSNGILTYTAKDIAYHLWKFGLLSQDFAYKPFGLGAWTTSCGGEARSYGKADMVINVIDHRQEYPQTMVKQALHALGYKEQADRLHHVSYGVVSLSPAAAAGLGVDVSDGKASYAMSGRQGIGIKIAGLLELMKDAVEVKQTGGELSGEIIAAAAIRYYLLRFSLQTEVVLDPEQATETGGNTGVYLMYAHARACRILDKAKHELGVIPLLPVQFPELANEERALLRKLADWPDALQGACDERAPHLLCGYAHESASLFNQFYGACPVLKAEKSQLPFRVWLTGKFQETLADALQILGLPAPRRM